MTRIRFGKPDASITANGFVIGLVAISGACSLVSPAEAAAIGLVAGLLVPFSVEWLDRLGFDDPSGSISVHGRRRTVGRDRRRTFRAGSSRTMAGAGRRWSRRCSALFCP